ncbi:MAG: carboxylating nicotinate-nucleotide diphosphorylase [Puniceicoccales bacterium]|jgi:nicotinate-nucleotide pyrophosphorylase (carboxylating)|nr:carboxylating nicotinate-nucleotide diphosphorylase [Puniceicoccales bacterium]
MKTPSQATQLFRRLQWAELDPGYLSQLIVHARDEDTAGLGLKAPTSRPGDPSTTLTPGATHPARAHLKARRDCTICGLPLLPLILDAYGPGCGVTLHCTDGDAVSSGKNIATLEGTAGTLLTAERVLLNFLQKLTGISTLTARYAAKLEGTTSKLLDTRKTTPGWRMLEKYAVATGGGWNHRLGLYDRVMLKDNHLAADGAAKGNRLAGLIAQAKVARPDLLIECEVDQLEQIPPVLEAGADIILLDNFSLEMLTQAIATIGERAWTEASGGITLESIRDIARLGPDFISTGALTHQAIWTDIGLDWD